MHTVFVYGTLKSGEKNNFLLQRDGCRFLGSGRTAEKYPLVVATRYNIPFVLFKPKAGQHVEGELYEVDDEGLKVLDELEMHPKLYERFIIDVIRTYPDGDGDTASTTVSAACYFLVKYRESLLELPRLESYSRFNQGLELNLPSAMTNEDIQIGTNVLDWSEVHTDFNE